MMLGVRQYKPHKKINMSQHDDQETSQEVSSDVIYQQDRAAIDIQISTAKNYPRNIKRSIENAISIVTMDQETAKTCTYSVPRGNKPITGPSVHLAKILAQVWGNMRIDAKVVGIDETHVTSESVCFDLENNLAIKTQVKRSIKNKTGGRFSDDMITVTGNAANSIAMRNAILSVIPRAVVDRVYNAAKQTITGDISDKNKFIAARTKVIEGLKSAYEVTESEILGAIGRASVEHITGDDIMTLIGIGTAIKDGDTDVEKAFKSKVVPKSDSEIKLDRKKGMLNDCKTIEDVDLLQAANPDWDVKLFDERKEQIKKLGI